MRFLNVAGFCIKPDKLVAFQQWVTANEERIKASYPEGSEYGGMYVAVMSSEKDAGDFYWLDILDSYGALDRSAAAGKDPESESSRIGQEFLEFVDMSREAGHSQILLKSVVDATIWDAPHE
jgi:hypothetical protein